MNHNKSLMLIVSVTIATISLVGWMCYAILTEQEPPSEPQKHQAEQKTQKKARRSKKSRKSEKAKPNVKPGNADSQERQPQRTNPEEEALTAAQRALLEELQLALDDESLRRVAKIVRKIQDEYRKGGDAAIPPYMREQAVEALSWFLPDSLAELIGFMADSNPDVLEDVMKNFTEGIDDAELSDHELAQIFKQVSPVVDNEDAIDAILMGLENDMRNSVAVATYKEIFNTGSSAIKERLVESIQDFTGEDDITTPEQLDKWLAENPDDEDDEDFYGNSGNDD